MTVFNEAYQQKLSDQYGTPLEELPVGKGVNQPDIVAEFSFCLARICIEQKIPFENIPQSVIAIAEERARGLIGKYEGNKPQTITPLNLEESQEGVLLATRYQSLQMELDGELPFQFCPQFAGAGFASSCEGDLATQATLIEVKTTLRRPSGRDIRQILVYLALEANSGQPFRQRIGLFNPRRGTLHLTDIDALVLRLSGGRPRSDVLSDLLSFFESNDLVFDRAF